MRSRDRKGRVMRIKAAAYLILGMLAVVVGLVGAMVASGEEGCTRLDRPDPSIHCDSSVPMTKTGVLGVLKVDQASLERLLRDHPKSKLRIAVYRYDKVTDDWVPNEPTPKESAEWIKKVMVGTVTCLDRMEEAMRAMEPYIMGVPNPLVLGDYRDASAKWQSAKACWRQP